MGPRKTIGQPIWPPDIYSVLAAELMMWSIACMAKLKVMNSTIGFSPSEGGADADAGEAVLGDRRVDDPFRAELLQEPLTDLVGALVLGDLFAHQEDVAVAAHLFRHGVAERLADRLLLGFLVELGLGGVHFGEVALVDRRLLFRGPRFGRRVGFRRVGFRRFRLGRFRRGFGVARVVRNVLALADEHGDDRIGRPRLPSPRPPSACRSCLRRPPRPPWSPCRSRFPQSDRPP